MKTIATALLIAAFTAQLAQAQPVSSSIIDGKVAINFDGTVRIDGLNLKSAGGYFIPIAPGTTDAPATPFTFLLANNANNVSYAALPSTPVEITGRLVTDVGYTGELAGVTEDMANSTYTNLSSQISFPTMAPEPATNTQALTAVLCLLGFRRRRSRCGGIYLQLLRDFAVTASYSPLWLGASRLWFRLPPPCDAQY